MFLFTFCSLIILFLVVFVVFILLLFVVFAALVLLSPVVQIFRVFSFTIVKLSFSFCLHISVSPVFFLMSCYSMFPFNCGFLSLLTPQVWFFYYICYSLKLNLICFVKLLTLQDKGEFTFRYDTPYNLFTLKSFVFRSITRNQSPAINSNTFI